jgi:DUF4097 and DUF4098 domain-containing protein YvlB
MKAVLVTLALLVVLVPAGFVLADLAFRKTEVRTHTFKGPLREIVVLSDSGDIELLRGDGRAARVRETRRYLFATPTFARERHRGVLTVEAKCDAPVLTCQNDLRLNVPRGVAVNVKTRSGDVDARGIEARRARVESNSGDLRIALTGLQRLVRVHTDSGDVDVRTGGARAVEARTDSGDVVVAAGGAPRDIVAVTDSGDVRVVAPAGAWRVRAESDSGDVTTKRISRNDRAGRSIDARSDSGDVTLQGG